MRLVVVRTFSVPSGRSWWEMISTEAVKGEPGAGCDEDSRDVGLGTAVVGRHLPGGGLSGSDKSSREECSNRERSAMVHGWPRSDRIEDVGVWGNPWIGLGDARLMDRSRVCGTDSAPNCMTKLLESRPRIDRARSGTLSGASRDGIGLFRGVPFAKPAVGGYGFIPTEGVQMREIGPFFVHSGALL